MGPSCSFSLRIGDDPSNGAGSGRARDVPARSTAGGPQNAPEAPPLPLGKGKRKINLIKYPKGRITSSLPFGMPLMWDLVRLVLHTSLLLLNVIGLPLVSEYGLLMF